MLFRPAAESDLDAIERHYTELLTHEAETGRSTTNWSLGSTPPGKLPRQPWPPARCGCWRGRANPSPASSSIITRMISMPPLVGSTPPRRSRCLWSIPSASRPGMPGRALAGNASPTSSSRPPPWAAPSSGWIPGPAMFLPSPFTGKTVSRFVAAPRSFFRAKYRRSLFSSNTAAHPAPIPRRSAAAKNGP